MKQDLKYGENPQQTASVEFDENSKDPLALGRFTVADGSPITSALATMGWVNLKDLNRGIDAVSRIAAAFEKNTG